MIGAPGSAAPLARYTETGVRTAGSQARSRVGRAASHRG